VLQERHPLELSEKKNHFHPGSFPGVGKRLFRKLLMTKRVASTQRAFSRSFNNNITKNCSPGRKVTQQAID
jgi:hypothetical protein